jgi:hypothetical protein
MKPTKLATLIWTLITGLTLLLLNRSVIAQDAWVRGQALFTANCIACHTSDEKKDSNVGEITNAINNQACMNGTIGLGCTDLRGLLQPPLATNISDIAAYLSTPKHATLSPSSHTFADTAIGATPKPALPFTLKNDGDTSRPGSNLLLGGATNSDANFIPDASRCPELLVSGQSCDVFVTFNPLSDQILAFTTTFGVTHDGFSGSSTATASGKGVKNLEIITTSLPPFVATQPNTSAPQQVTIANRLNSTVRLCLADENNLSAPGDFHLVGRIYDAAPGRCATIPPSIDRQINQNVLFTPTDNGPRLARLTAQRISGGTPVGPLEDIALRGNIGPFMSISGVGLTNNMLFNSVRQDINAGAAAPSLIVLSNAGNETMRLSSINIPLVAGASSAEYAANGCTAGTFLTQGVSCNLSVFFDPIELGTRTTTLTIDYSDAFNTLASRRTALIDLRGQGTRGASLLVRDAGGTALAAGSLVAFGQQNIALIYQRRLTLLNIGSDERLAVSAPTIVPGTAGFDFVIPGGRDSCSPLTTGFELAPNTSCVLYIRFLPTAVTNYASNLTLASVPVGSAAPPTALVLALSGKGADGRPNLAWQLDDGSALGLLEVPGLTRVGTSTPPQVSLRLANFGPGAATLSLLNIIGVESSSFTLEPSSAPGRCSFGDATHVLDQGSTCSVVITFRPQTAGVKTASLQIVSTGNTPAPVEIRAQAMGPVATIALMATPASLNLNEVRVGAQSAPAMVTLTNDGMLAAVVTSIDASPGFAVEPRSCSTLPFTMEPRSSCTLAVRFAPGSTGPTSGRLRVQVSDVVAPVEVALLGTGVEAADVSSGGCSVSDGHSPADPTLWALVLLAAVVLSYRGRRSSSATHGRYPRRGSP